MKKFYAVKNGRNIGVYDSWNDCKQQVDGYSNAIYKSFTSFDEATAFIKGDKTERNEKLKKIKKHIEMQAYIDGSYDNEKKYYSYAGIMFFEKEEKEFAFADNNPEKINLRNVAGEIEAAIYVINYAVERKIKSLEIFYDYTGIENWATKAWKANNPFTKNYVTFIEKMTPQLNIIFTKVKAHSGNKYNEKVDQLAKEALLKVESGIHKEGEAFVYSEIQELKGTKRSLNIGIAIDNIIYPQEFIYQKLKEKWKKAGRMLKEIIEIKSFYDDRKSIFIFNIKTETNNWEEVKLSKEDLNG